MALTKLPDVGRIQGVEFQLASVPEKSTCLLRYTGHIDTQSYEISIPAPDALYLLNLLAAMERDSGLRQRNRADRSVIEGRVKSVGFSNKPNTKPLDQQMALLILDPEEQEEWNVRFNMVDALYASGEIRRVAKKLGIPVKD